MEPKCQRYKKYKFFLFFDLQETLLNNDKILNNAVNREENMQNKYCNDINNAINLNKQLNQIINKKNIQVIFYLFLD